ncbi:anaphase-promoting complex, cyclosome, subunit 4-domain-containing protein [Fimicolochytrium jonesii]|uniref:anaphase-promoting complex, cyclosome, subunit 4-domain-containing protein n=1 Tax=Fimicolochytrium jonesii TaxID=1396493 RepID=UPI0022FE29BC|nr:anaphase-promoting complex, cyclosome, subunit 4-domain-containing protein [Fimicolochytrium jonesii]KAI8817179.1 anaphase-promoting complex, cyclosome, subunit 4-domain-containing protein [Fimicolochytrium jonesii]
MTAAKPFNPWVSLRTQQPVASFSWCPMKDLLALTYETNYVEVLRLPEWTSICTLARDSQVAVNAVSWKQDGRSLAIGFADGRVEVCDVEAGTLIAKFTGPTDGIKLMDWVSTDVYGSQKQRIVTFGGLDEKYLPPLPSSEGQLRKQSSTINITDRPGSPEVAPGQLDIIASSDGTGWIQLSVAGRLPAGQTDLSAMGEKRFNNPEISQLWFTSNPSNLCAQVIDQSDNALKTLYLVHFEPRLLGTHRTLLYSVTTHLAQVETLVAYLEGGVEAIERENKIISETTSKEITAFDRVLEEHNIDTDFGSELLQLLLVGVPSTILEPYLTQRLNQGSALRSWHKSVEASMLNIGRVACTKVIPAIERLLLHLDELKGLGQWGIRHGTPVVNVDAILKCIEHVRSLALFVESHQLETLTNLQNFVEFSKWLAESCRAVEADPESPYEFDVDAADVRKVMAYVRRTFLPNDYWTREELAAVNANAGWDMSDLAPIKHYSGLLTRTDAGNDEQSVVMRSCVRLYSYPSGSRGAPAHKLDVTSMTTWQRFHDNYIAFRIEHDFNPDDEYAYPILCVTRQDCGSSQRAAPSDTPLELACVQLCTDEGVRLDHVAGQHFLDDDQLIVMHEHESADGVRTGMLSSFRYPDFPYASISPNIKSSDQYSGLINLFLRDVNHENVPSVNACHTTVLEAPFMELAVNCKKGTVALLDESRRKVAVLEQ